MKQGDLVKFSGCDDGTFFRKDFEGQYGIFQDWYCATRGYANIFFFSHASTHPILVENLTVISRL